jgi:HAD superfamily hydrolase (TIGR01549 family)
MSYDTVLFDNDGVLIRNTDGEVMRNGVLNAFRAAGVERPDPDHVSSITDFSAVTVPEVCMICHEYEIDPERFWALREREVHAVQREEMRAKRKTPFDDIDALGTLDSLGAALGIVSNNQHDTVAFMIEHFGLEGRFETFYGVESTFDGLRWKKPDPYYLYRAIEDTGAEDILYVGDKETDVHAAQSAGADAAYIRRSDDQPGADTFDRPPEFEVESLTELASIVSGDRRAIGEA